MHLSVNASLLAVSETTIIAALNLEVIAVRSPALSIGRCPVVSSTVRVPVVVSPHKQASAGVSAVAFATAASSSKYRPKQAKQQHSLSTACTAVSSTHHGANPQQSVESAAPAGLAGRHGFFDFFPGPRPWFADDSIYASYSRTFIWPAGHLGAHYVR
jgi:hypothetical protein